MKKLVVVICAIALFGAYSCKKNENTIQTNGQDINFILQGSRSNNTEIQLGQLAADSSTDPLIKAFGQKIVTDHTTIQTGLKSLVTNFSFNDTLDTEHKALYDQLKTLSGRSFDSAYIVNTVKDEKKIQQLFFDELNVGLNENFQNFAAQYLNTINQNMAQAKTLAANF
jgi:putative membrane protein